MFSLLLTRSLLKHVEENHPEVDAAAYKKKLTGFIAGKILKEFDEYQFFTGESGNVDGLVAYMYWEEETPIMIFLKHALIEEKLVSRAGKMQNLV